MSIDLLETEKYIQALAGAAGGCTGNPGDPTGTPGAPCDVAMDWAVFPDFKDRPAGAARAAQRRRGSLHELAAWLEHENRFGQGVFVTVQETDGNGAKRENVRALRAVFIDDDHGTLTADDLEKAGLRPSLVVSSKAGGHFYWLLEPGEDLSDFTPCQKKLASKFGTDPSVSDLARVLRAPGFAHLKDPTDPWDVFVEDGGSGQRHTIKEIADAFGLLTKPQTTALALRPRSSSTVTPEAAAILDAARARAAQTPRSPFSSPRANLPTRVRLAAQYLAEKVPPAIQGQHGDDATFRAACFVSRDFALDEDSALEALTTSPGVAGLPGPPGWNDHCQPPWEESDLRIKIRSALSPGEGKGEIGSKCAPAAGVEIGSEADLVEFEPTVVQTSEIAIAAVDGNIQKTVYEQLRDHTAALLGPSTIGEGNNGPIRMNDRGQKLFCGNVEIQLDDVVPVILRRVDEVSKNRLGDPEEGKQRVIPWNKTVVQDQLLSLAKENHFDPVVDYLLSLPEWDGVDRSQDLLDCLRVANPLPIYREYLRKTLISAVARAIDPGCKVDTMLILQEDNGGKYKSTFFSALAGRGIGNKWKLFSDAHVAVDNKDTWPIINRVWLIEWTEMAQLQRADSREAIKGFLSRGEDDFRPPYGRDTITYPRRSIFVGTTNQKEILENSGGNRRFWMIEDVGATGKIDLSTVASMRNSLWSQAVAEFAAQYRIKKETGEYLIGNEGAKIGWWLEEESEIVLEDLQKGYIREPASREIIHAWIDQKDEVTVSQIINEGPKALQSFSFQSRRGEMEVAGALKSLGWIKSRSLRNGIRVHTWTRGPEALPKGSVEKKTGGVFAGNLSVVR